MQCRISWTSIQELLNTEEGASLVSDRSADMQHYYGKPSRVQTVVGRILLAYQLRDSFDWQTLIRQMKYSENGMPFIEGGWFFSISHVGNYVAVAVSRTGAIGLDIEDQSRDLVALSSWFCHPREMQSVTQNGELVEIWTRKEAMAKLFGQGWGSGYATMDLTEDILHSEIGTYHIRTRPLEGDVILSLATGEPVEELAVGRLDVATLINHFLRTAK